MTRNFSVGRRFVGFIAVAMAAVCGSTARADVPFTITMNYDVTGTGQYEQYRTDFAETMSTIENLLVSWRGPRAIEAQYTGFTIDVTFDAIDGEFGVLAFAGPRDVLRWGGPGYGKHGTSGAVVRTGATTFDEDDMAYMAATGILRTTIMHETFHALGFPGVWDDFGYRSRVGAGFVGPNALAAYREATGNRFAPFVPVETAGGGGTAGGHWSGADPYFYNPQTGVGELMIGFATEQAWLSPVTLAQFRDLGYQVPSLGGGRVDDFWPRGPGLPKEPAPDDDDDDGRTDDGGPEGPGGPGGPGRPGGPTSPGNPGGWVDWGGRGGLNSSGGYAGGPGITSVTGVPEPTSALVLIFAAGFQFARNRRRR
ncbi:MAG: hypothetical protein Q8M16_18835 [Pirellulaceae bacterium]|nr:hypothetical protein [Pirellulaceae bacterium]